ncbi:DUF2461 domain-containing protein [Tsukamurella tyrosinosolvens]|uniref:DUF2461 domain-containing protein n=1 Tax=Tsukamurella tyrosinosolvens TaxID=57704 RepID=UPI00079496F9|nr:DUF2461 domain-containing protein [Tsukamurella tyrosinosolvens]KXP08873.1 hypothetical protein AXK59_00175 [Tsukamurella tyrosinosolvens]KZL97101.1 hypothetical protein AXX05_16715 [Tsukamurella tyrosinosolvens]MCA4997012.1 DUF2461 domain-containing protein [Tsukamurella tyrosinosolvens]
MSFTGFPEAALDFYDDLEADNSKVFWEAHKEVYKTAVAAPMAALTEELADEFGTAKIFRPYRDVRFSKDKTPYKTHQGAFIGVGPATGYYLQIGAPGVRVGAGFYAASPTRLAAFRKAIDNDLYGPALEKVIAKLRRTGWEIGGETLKTAPRGWDADHPRIELLRHKSLSAMRDYGFEEIIHTPKLVPQIRKHWRETSALLDWLVEHGDA